VIAAINPIIRGWGNYFRKANVRKLFHHWTGGSDAGCGRSSPSDGGTPHTARIRHDGW
jgi:hypothetical protein